MGRPPTKFHPREFILSFSRGLNSKTHQYLAEYLLTFQHNYNHQHHTINCDNEAIFRAEAEAIEKICFYSTSVVLTLSNPTGRVKKVKLVLIFQYNSTSIWHVP